MMGKYILIVSLLIIIQGNQTSSKPQVNTQVNNSNHEEPSNQSKSDACVAEKLKETPNLNSTELKKAREIARYLCTSGIDRDLRVKFNEVIRERGALTTARISCYKSYLMHLNASGPLVMTFEEHLRDIFNTKSECQKEIEEINTKCFEESTTSPLNCEVRNKKFLAEAFLKILIIANGSYSLEVRNIERENYANHLKKIQNQKLKCTAVEN
ncbi:unnamed protein product [Chironomus riparius]|uniref:Uncharacterized protein n=1 Tax=Chironomus riparius TaxID=315576 RepID=A0A9N9S7K2_9DIPT|nr:unnamed protein product [Chironomus riparius]